MFQMLKLLFFKLSNSHTVMTVWTSPFVKSGSVYQQLPYHPTPRPLPQSCADSLRPFGEGLANIIPGLLPHNTVAMV